MNATDKLSPAQRAVTLLPLLAVLAITAVLYSTTFDNELTYWDDNRYITENARIRELSPGSVAQIFIPTSASAEGQKAEHELTEYLPMTTLVHAIVYRVQGLKPAGYHVVNLALYIVDLVLLYILVLTLLESRFAAFVATLLYAVHPAHVESVTWASATKDVLSMAFLLSSFLLYIRYRRGRAPGAVAAPGARSGAWLFYAASVACFTLGMLSKSLVVTLPIMLAAYDLCSRERRLGIIDKIPYLAIGILLTLVYIRVNTQFTEVEYLTTGLSHYRLLLTNIEVLADYMGMVVAPLWLNVFYTYTPDDIPTTLFAARTLLSAFVICVALAAAVYSYFRGSRIVTFCVFWFFVAFLPILNIVPSSTIKADRYLFIPTVGVALLAGWLAIVVRERNLTLRWAVAIAFAAWVVMLGALSFDRNADWQNGITIWSDSLKKQPEVSRPHYIIGNEYRHRGDLARAILSYTEALRIEPTHRGACNNLGAAYGMLGRFGDAARTLEHCLELEPENTSTALNLTRAYMALGRADLAEAPLRGVLAREPDNAAALRLGNMLWGKTD